VNGTMPAGDRGYRGGDPRAGNPDLEGLCPALSDWSAELESCRTRDSRMKIRNRIERLEHELLRA